MNFRFSEVGNAPDKPGIYAWYYRIELTDKDINDCIEQVDLTQDESKRKSIIKSFLERNLFRYFKEMPYTVDVSGPLKPRYRGAIDHLPEISAALVDRLARKPSHLKDLKQTLLMTVPLFASPIYIGVAINLRNRLRQHVRLIGELQHRKASALDSGIIVPMGETEEDRDHKFAFEVAMTRDFRSSNLIVNTLELPDEDVIRFDLENILNRINYPLCGRN